MELFEEFIEGSCIRMTAGDKMVMIDKDGLAVDPNNPYIGT